jgi:two-component system, NarL family, sensor kinase
MEVNLIPLMRYFVVFIYAVCSTLSFAQKADVSDAKKLSDSVRYYLDHNDLEKASKCAALARAFAEKQGKELALAYLMSGNVELRKSQLKEARQFYEKSLAFAKHSDESDMQARALSNIGSILSQLDQYDSAEQILKESLKLSTDKDALTGNYLRLGVLYKRQQQYDTAIKYYLKAITVSKETGDTLGTAKTMANIGNIYSQQENWNRALEYYLHSLSLLDTVKHAYSFSGISTFASNVYQELGKYDEAEKMLKRALRLIEGLQLNSTESAIHSSMGTLQYKRGRLDEAIFYLNKSIGFERTVDRKGSFVENMLLLAEVYIAAGQFEKAKASLKEAQSVSPSQKNPLSLRHAFLLMSRLDSAQGDYRSALANYKQSVLYKDTLLSVEKAKAIEEVNKKFEAQQKEEVIKEQQFIIQQQQTKQTFFIIIVVIVAAAGIIIDLFIRRRRSAQLSAEAEQQRKQKLLAIVIAQEQMQQKIARDLHDSLVQILGAAKINVESARALNNPDEVAAKLQETAKVIDQACQDVRSISHQLLPYSLQKHGLVIALQELFEKHPKKGAEVYEFKHSGIIERFKNTIEINVYRIVQELMNNIAKHANANKILIQLSRQADNLLLWVSDDGTGFNPDNIKPGAGLMNIESRLQVVHGTMRIESKAGEGTTTIINIPLI